MDAIASAKTVTETAKKDTKLKDLFKGTFIGEDKTPLANSKVNLVNENGEILQSTTTDGMGAFHFDYLTPDQNVLFVLDENDTQLKKLKKVFLADAKGAKVREVFPNKAVFSLLDVKKVVTPIASVKKDTKTATVASNSALNTPGVVLRVQLGAYKKKLSKAVFKDINDLIEIRTDDGLYKYMTGSFKSIDDAAKLKVEMILNGYPGAFIAAYKDGKRITLQEAGATLANKEDVLETPDNNALSAVNKKLVKFKVQVGVFKNTPPDNVLSIFSKLRDLSGERTSSGLTRYVVGPFNSYKEAEAYKKDIVQRYGLSDSFVVATFNNEYISIPEALEILK
ncbi:MAG: SPOR domain-containing protein [Bacteroidetes bacterium]|nr:SPOR domain-containing protein [Bacteroidota bacterium]